MSEQDDRTSPAAGATELLSPARFEEELRRIARFRPPLPAGDPLDAAVKKIERNPAFTQSRLLTRILTALADRKGEFRRAELSALDMGTVDMVVALMDASAAGKLTREEWTCAVDLANAAQLAASG